MKTFKHGWDACEIKQVNADKLERYIINKLDAISNDDFYIDALVRIHSREENGLGSQPGLEQRETRNQNSAKALKNLMKTVIEILKIGNGNEKYNRIKKYISEIIYSPEDINIKFNNLYINDSSADLSTRVGARRQSQDESKCINTSINDYELSGENNGKLINAADAADRSGKDKAMVRYERDGGTFNELFNGYNVQMKNKLIYDKSLIRSI